MTTFVLVALAAVVMTSVWAMDLQRFSDLQRDGDTTRMIDYFLPTASRYYGTDRKRPPMVLMEELDPDGDRVLVEFAYSDGKEQFPGIEDRKKVIYNIIRDSQIGGKISPEGTSDFMNKNQEDNKAQPDVKPDRHRDTQKTKDGDKDFGDVETSEEKYPQPEPPTSDEQTGDEIDANPRWSLSEFTEDSPISSRFPKYFVDIFAPLSPFPEEDRYGTEKRRESNGGDSSKLRQKKQDTPFFPSGEVRPPPRAGPPLFPQSMFEREFRIPIN